MRKALAVAISAVVIGGLVTLVWTVIGNARRQHPREIQSAYEGLGPPISDSAEIARTVSADSGQDFLEATWRVRPMQVEEISPQIASWIARNGFEPRYAGGCVWEARGSPNPTYKGSLRVAYLEVHAPCGPNGAVPISRFDVWFSGWVGV